MVFRSKKGFSMVWEELDIKVIFVVILLILIFAVSLYLRNILFGS
ncbi:MAG: hypothetical protein ABIG89_04315 [Candidatus Woesearchaeota archaeon]